LRGGSFGCEAQAPSRVHRVQASHPYGLIARFQVASLLKHERRT
jgi:hypothetical protein